MQPSASETMTLVCVAGGALWWLRAVVEPVDEGAVTTARKTQTHIHYS
jgi:hypothetical protein